VSHVMPWK